MQTTVYQDAAEVAENVAKELHSRLRAGGRFGFPTGRTMDGVYAALARLNAVDPVDPARIHAFMVDEYLGLPPGSPHSYVHYLTERVFKPLRLKPSHVHVPALERLSPHDAAEDYEARIRDGGIDLQLLGLGPNGHIGFNEPGSPRHSRTRVVDVAEATRRANAVLFARPEDVPVRAVSIGVATILDAREVWMVVTGAAKREVVAELLRRAPGEDFPASFLKEHPRFRLFRDRASGEEIA